MVTTLLSSLEGVRHRRKLKCPFSFWTKFHINVTLTSKHPLYFCSIGELLLLISNPHKK